VDYIERCEAHVGASSFMKDVFELTIERLEIQILMARTELEKMEENQRHAEKFFKELANDQERA